MLLKISGCFWAFVSFRIIRDQYEAPVPVLFHVAEKVLEVAFEFLRSSMRVDIVAYAFAGPEEGDEDVDPLVLAGCRDVALCSLKHPCGANAGIQPRPHFIFKSDQGPLFSRAAATCL